MTIDGGLVIDLSHMKKITVDRWALTALVQPGLTIGEFYVNYMSTDFELNQNIKPVV